VLSAPTDGRGSKVNPNAIMIGMKSYRPNPCQFDSPGYRP